MKYLLILVVLSACGTKKTDHNDDIPPVGLPKGKNGKDLISLEKKELIPTDSCKQGDPVVNQLYYIRHDQEYIECSVDKNGNYRWWFIQFDQYVCDEKGDCAKL